MTLLPLHQCFPGSVVVPGGAGLLTWQQVGCCAMWLLRTMRDADQTLLLLVYTTACAVWAPTVASLVLALASDMASLLLCAFKYCCHVLLQFPARRSQKHRLKHVNEIDSTWSKLHGAILLKCCIRRGLPAWQSYSSSVLV